MGHYATSRTVRGSIPGGVTGDFFRGSSPTEPCALVSTQPLKMSTRDFSWGKGGRCVWLTTYHPCIVSNVKKIRGLNLPGTPWATSACCRMTFTLYPIYNHNCRNISTVYIYNKTSIERNILTIKQNTSGSRPD